MRFIADECVERQIVERMREGGYKVVYIVETNPGISDAEVINIVNSEKGILITCDKDFYEYIFQQKIIKNGAILLRLAGVNNKIKGEIVMSVIKEREGEIESSFSVISPNIVRIRKVE